MDESATGSVNFFGPVWRAPSGAHPPRPMSPAGILSAMHLRAPSIDRGVQAFLWSVVFFLVLYFGMVAVEVGKATSLLVSVVSAFLIFLFVRSRGT